MNIAVIIQKFKLCIDTVFDNVVDLAFAPVWFFYNVVTGIIQIINTEPEPEEELEEPQEENGSPVVTQYPSVNEGRYSDECDYPIGHKRIGFKQYES